MKDLRGKVAVVTGAASGIGAALAFQFAGEGMKVVLADVESEALSETAARLQKTGATIFAVRTDVSKAEEVEALAAESLRAFGAVHVLCNNAGVGSPPGPIWERTTADWQWVLGVNLWGLIHGIRVFVPIMLKQDIGHVVNTASVEGLFPSPLMGIYDATKYAVISISETLYLELSMKKTRVRTSVLCPGPLQTRIRSSERNRPPDLANARAEQAVPTHKHYVPIVQGGGRDVDFVAECVVRAIHNEQLYILTHPEFNPHIRARIENILAERNPTVVESREARMRSMQSIDGNRLRASLNSQVRHQISFNNSGKGGEDA